MSLLQCWNSAPKLKHFSHSSVLSSNSRYRYSPSCIRKRRSTARFTCLLKLGVEDIAGIVHNQVLIAAGLSAAVGQLSKPFTGVLLYGRDFDLRAAFQAGGFPSTHSSAVVATATSLALDRGFSDSIFGLTLVYAGLIMYDSQGVRREVGNHAKVLNKTLTTTQVGDKDDFIDGQYVNSSTIKEENLASLLSKETISSVPYSKEAPLSPAKGNKTKTSQKVAASSLPAAEEGKKNVLDGLVPLKESIGHTEIEVIAGAFLGFLVGIAVHNII